MLERYFDFKRASRLWSKQWEQAGLFTPEVPSRKEPFVIILPPPNVTGILTVGHFLGNTVQDALIRWKRMQGYNTLWLPGTDHAGIATQNVVERHLEKMGRKREEMGRESFLEYCWRWKEEYHRRIVEQLKAMGCSLDWTRECFTLDEPRSRAVRRVFVTLFHEGLIYRGNYIVNWCPFCRTAISDEEVVYEEKDSFLYWIEYPLAEGGSLTVATTRPETMLGDTAVAVNPEDEGNRGIAGKTAILPLVGRRIPVIADEAVDPDFGSGFVKVTPAHDPNDFLIAQRHGLPAVVVIDRGGLMTAEAGSAFAGLDRDTCRQKVVAVLKSKGLLRKVEPYRHAVGHHDRCRTVIEPLLSREWFVRMKPLAEPAIECVEKGEVKFYPPRWRNVYLSWMREIRDWCISRQLWWGHRIPVWYCPEGHLTVEEADPEACSRCGSSELKQDEDVLDTWFSSWLWTFSPMGWPDQTEDLRTFHPTSVLVTGSDIIFFWVARMIMASLHFLGQVPFRHVFLTGIVRDTLGRKMSKTLGNSPDPLGIIDHYGADAFRFTIAMLSPPGHDVYFAEDKVEVGRNFVNKVWQASRFVLTATDGGELLAGPGEAGPLGSAWRREFPRPLAFEPELSWEDRWILSACERCVQDVDEKLEAWRINEAATKIYEFFWHQYCDWYIEMAKVNLRSGKASGTKAVLLFVLGQAVKLLHPFMPFLTEELWAKLPMSEGLLLTQSYPRPPWNLVDDEAEGRMELFKGLVTAARNIRAAYRIAPARSIPLHIRTDDQASLEPLLPGLRALAGASEVVFGPQVKKEKGSASTPVGAVELVVPLGGLADFAAERSRLEKEREKLARALAAVDRKLSNRDFLAKAKPEVVAKEKGRKARLEAELAKVEESIGLLEKI